jgi:tetratricopeptide (TPR) repeat protein
MTLYNEILPLEKMERWTEAIGICQQITTRSPNLNWSRLAASYALGHMYVERKKDKEAIEVFSKFETEVHNAGKALNQQDAKIFTEFAGCLLRTNQFEQAESRYRQGLSIYEAVYGKDDEHVLLDLYGISESLFNQKKYSEAIPNLRRCLQISKTQHDKVQYKQSLNTLKQCYTALKDESGVAWCSRQSEQVEKDRDWK